MSFQSAGAGGPPSSRPAAPTACRTHAPRAMGLHQAPMPAPMRHARPGCQPLPCAPRAARGVLRSALQGSPLDHCSSSSSSSSCTASSASHRQYVPLLRPLSHGLPGQRSGAVQQAVRIASGPAPSRAGSTPSSRGSALAVHASAAIPAGAAPSGGDGSGPQGLWGSAVRQYDKFMGLAGKFMPMVGLFFLMAFVNTILDSLKDTLVITATGGGAQVIPYLTVYAVLPSSLIFLFLYSYASQFMSRAALFNAIVAVFMAFFAFFALVLYPNHHVFHPHDLADVFAKKMPMGVEGLVGMFRNWTFTLFFCMSELWGDVVLGLLFWGLANDTTTLADAPTLYPLFGLGANVAQALAGSVLKMFSGVGHDPTSFGSEIQSLMTVVMVFSGLTVAVHAYIHSRHVKARRAAAAAAVAAAAQQLAAGGGAQPDTSLSGSVSGSVSATGGQDAARAASHSQASSSSSASSPLSNGSSSGRSSGRSESAVSMEVMGAGVEGAERGAAQARRIGKKKDKGPKPSVWEIFRVLAASVPIRCLAVMSLAQGLCTSLMEFAWKSHIGLLFPSPAEFTSFLGDVSVWQGVVTGFLMVLSPAMFDRMGWSGVAAATPGILLWGGAMFFATCLVYQYVFAAHAATAVASVAVGGTPFPGMSLGPAGLTLSALVYGGALLYVFSKSAKFSLFKPAEEMVYISLDEEGRTKGKAAIDVVGSQAGKSGGSVLQQVLLLASGGSIAAILPVMALCFFGMAQGWLRSVALLSAHANYGHQSTVHESFSDVTISLDEDDGPLGVAPGGTRAPGSGSSGSPASGSGSGSGAPHGSSPGSASPPPSHMRVTSETAGSSTPMGVGRAGGSSNGNGAGAGNASGTVSGDGSVSGGANGGGASGEPVRAQL